MYLYTEMIYSIYSTALPVIGMRRLLWARLLMSDSRRSIFLPEVFQACNMVVTRRGVRVLSPSKTTPDQPPDVQVRTIKVRRQRASRLNSPWKLGSGPNPPPPRGPHVVTVPVYKPLDVFISTGRRRQGHRHTRRDLLTALTPNLLFSALLYNHIRV